MLPYVCVTYVEHGASSRCLVDHLETVPVVLGVRRGADFGHVSAVISCNIDMLSERSISSCFPMHA